MQIGMFVVVFHYVYMLTHLDYNELKELMYSHIFT